MNKKVVFLPYDMDTAIGINNEGALVFGYSLEDTDHVGGADVYNGQESVLWCNLRDVFGPELKALYQQLRSTGALSYNKVEQVFELHQEKWPEAVFNEDAFYKYIKPLIDDDDESYLSMLQGSKAEQRKWWLYNRFKYLDSKYNAGDSQTDYIQLRGYAKDNIVVTPYADIYITIRWASYLNQQRATRNTAYTMICPLDNVNDSEIYIYSASQLASVGDLSGLKVGFADFHNATKLQELILGNSDNQYDNPNLRSINVGNLKLLRKIDARNCSGLGTYADQKTVGLSGCNGIEEVYFDGTNILGVELPNGGFLKKLHLPGTITNLTIRNQTRITEFVCPDFSNISTLNLENTSSVINIGNIVDNVATGCRIRLFNYRLDFADIAAVHTFLDKFDNMTGLDQNGDNTALPQLFITVHVPIATGDEIDSITARYPDITVDADVASYYVRYYNWEGDTLLYTETVAKGQNGSYATQPTHASTDQYTFSFVGWNTNRNSTTNEAGCRDNVQRNINVYAAYTTTIRTYTVTFAMPASEGGATLQSSSLAYGATPVFSGQEPVSSDPEKQFNGWTPAISSVTADITYVAAFRDTSGFTRKIILREISYIEDSVITYIRSCAFEKCGTMESCSFPLVTSIGASAFNTATLLISAYLPELVTIGNYGFYNCVHLSSVNLSKVEQIGDYAFNGCGYLSIVSFPAATRIKSYAFYNDMGLTSVYIPEVSTIGSYAFASCRQLTTITADKVTTLEPMAFQNCWAISIAYFSSVTSLGYGAFTGCSSLSMASFPEVLTIGSAAFNMDSNLESISFPKATVIGSNAFASCYKLTEASFPEVSIIWSNAFNRCSSLSTIYFPKVERIGSSAFALCSELTILSFPKVSQIENDAFRNCPNITTVIIGNSDRVVALGNSSAFNSASNITFYVPDSLVSAYSSAMVWANFSSRIKGISEIPI